MSLHLEIVTPEMRVFSGLVDSVLLTCAEGEICVLPGHTPLVAILAPGEMIYVRSGVMERYATGDGLVEVTGRRVRILTDMAVGEDDIDESVASAALKRAQEALAAMGPNPSLGDEEVAVVTASIQKAMAQLHVKQRRRCG